MALNKFVYNNNWKSSWFILILYATVNVMCSELCSQ